MHISFMTGYIAPVREIVELAKPKGIQVFVDGAHAFAHFPFTRDELGADYYGTSLHKWLHAPIGTGFLYVRRDKIKSLWPLMAAAVEQDDNIRKYEEIGTHPAANHNAIAVAIAFNRGIGMDRKIARLRYPARPLGEAAARGERSREDDHADRPERRAARSACSASTGWTWASSAAGCCPSTTSSRRQW